MKMRKQTGVKKSFDKYLSTKYMPFLPYVYSTIKNTPTPW